MKHIKKTRKLCLYEFKSKKNSLNGCMCYETMVYEYGYVILSDICDMYIMCM